MTNLGQYHFIDKPIAVGVTGAWGKGPTITAENLKSGSGSIEHLPPGCLHSERSPRPSQPAKSSSSNAPAKQGATMWFGKFRHELIVDVFEKDPGYIRWCRENVSGFEKQWNLLQIEE